ncbi:MAG: GntR family transcriptional regulator [Gammaproteobacteria bacterium]|nr:GntR family transcriptional regulator [Gammaproteobacteria bacterium]
MTGHHVPLRPLEVNVVLKDKVYEALKEAITSMDIYSDDEPPKLDERRLAEELGVSRTPIREALSRLEQEGLVQTIPRRGAFVVRKTKKEILEMICVWAALEGMAARLATKNASAKDIASLRKLFATFDDSDEAQAHIDEYSDTNIQFHQSIMRLSKCELLNQIAESLFIHMRSIRTRTIKERDRAGKSIIDHMRIIEALENRDTDLAERLVREHALQLADHVREYVDYLG